jgi:gluconokinase
MTAAILVVMGVSGAGKTTVGAPLARRLGVPFKEGDDLHPPANVEKLRRHLPLEDADRAPWLKAVAAWIDDWRRAGSGGVITCSALKRRYRDALAENRPSIIFVYLKGSPAVLAARVGARRGHFMPPSLLGSQLADLEEPGGDERAISVDGDLPAPAQIDLIARGDLALCPPRAPVE